MIRNQGDYTSKYSLNLSLKNESKMGEGTWHPEGFRPLTLNTFEKTVHIGKERFWGHFDEQYQGLDCLIPIGPEMMPLST